MFDYMTCTGSRRKWNVSLRWVQRLCKENRVKGSLNINRVWLIPKETKRPLDMRLRTNRKGDGADEIE